MSPPSSGSKNEPSRSKRESRLKVEAVCFSETSLSLPTTQHYNYLRTSNPTKVLSCLSFNSAFKSVKLSLGNNKTSLVSWIVPVPFSSKMRARQPRHFCFYNYTPESKNKLKRTKKVESALTGIVIFTKTNDDDIISLGAGGAISQEVSPRLPTAAARACSQVRSCGICGKYTGIGVASLRLHRLPLPIFITFI
jgi:hypothetical protein